MCIRDSGDTAKLQAAVDKAQAAVTAAQAKVDEANTRLAKAQDELKPLKQAQEAGDTEKIAQYSTILYNQALIVENMPVDDPIAYAQAVTALME